MILEQLSEVLTWVSEDVLKGIKDAVPDEVLPKSRGRKRKVLKI